MSRPAYNLLLDFLTGKLDDRITFTRTSNATYIDSAGVLQTAGNDVARFDHDISDNSALGLLIEDQRTNNALWGRDFTNAAWVKANISAAKDATGLDGTANSASTLTAAAANGTALQTITIASAAYTFSVYVKRKTGSGNIDITDNNGTNWTTLTGLSSTAWTRHDITRTQANPVIDFRIVTSGDEIEVDYAGLEAGSFRTSPIATTTAAATRSDDVATMTGTDFSSWFNATEGTFVVEGRTAVSAPTSGRHTLFSVDDGSNNEQMRVQDNSSNEIHFLVRTINVAVVNLTAGVPGQSTNFKVGCAYAVNDYAAVLGGGSVITDTLGALPSGIDRLRIGLGVSNINAWNGHLGRIIYYPVRLPNATPQALTA